MPLFVYPKSVSENNLWYSITAKLSATTDDLNNLSPEERAYYLIRIFDAEVCNGGLEQFFFNSAGDHYQEVLSALKLAGAFDTAKLLMRSAKATFGSEPPPTDSNARFYAMREKYDKKAWQDKMERLDDAYYADAKKLEELVTRFAMTRGLLSPFLPPAQSTDESPTPCP